MPRCWCRIEQTGLKIYDLDKVRGGKGESLYLSADGCAPFENRERCGSLSRGGASKGGPAPGWEPTRLSNQPPHYCSFAYSALDSFRMGMSESASFQSVRKSLYAASARTRAASASAPCEVLDRKAFARATPRCANAPVQQFQTMPPWSRILWNSAAASGPWRIDERKQDLNRVENRELSSSCVRYRR